ncbi:DUF2218 domain-containing protein [Haematobacter missouriensis]|uniref:Uncharacterized protein n=1 Tax=Haematobacter missouriensis TaxID=366616 RepID=A0ABX3ZV67_9RHOB|nr:DUF2218 domain-containing protein [Haematobacter missouriensis]OWJ77438.1 hypothetical protein CDV53_05765 [Haematobacter missouriensis]
MFTATTYFSLPHAAKRLPEIAMLFAGAGEVSHDRSRADALMPFGHLTFRAVEAGLDVVLVSPDPRALAQGRKMVEHHLRRVVFPLRFEGLAWTSPVALS